MSENTSEVIETAAEPVVEAKTTRKRAAKAAEPDPARTPRKWQDVVPQIQKLREEGLTVPQICEELQLTYVLVNQVIQQSYKMSVDTIGVFERQEWMRLNAGA